MDFVRNSNIFIGMVFGIKFVYFFLIIIFWLNRLLKILYCRKFIYWFCNNRILIRLFLDEIELFYFNSLRKVI